MRGSDRRSRHPLPAASGIRPLLFGQFGLRSPPRQPVCWQFYLGQLKHYFTYYEIFGQSAANQLPFTQLAGILLDKDHKYLLRLDCALSDLAGSAA